MNSESQNCTCSSDGYSTNCPDAFTQGGKLLHMVHGSDQERPKIYVSPKSDMSALKAKALGYQDEISGRSRVDPDRTFPSNVTDMMRFSSNTESDYSTNPADNEFNQENTQFQEAVIPEPLINRHSTPKKYGRGRFEDDSNLQEEHRRGLRKFESLKIGHETLTSMSIGGYVVDLPRAAQKAMECAPLPPARLPIIFKEDDLNFHHHFFQGLEILIGRGTFLEMVSSTKYYRQVDMIMMPFIEQIIHLGYERSDTEITIFTKRVLMSTFDLEEETSSTGQGNTLMVAANLWGFQYIECGMQCKESDLRMWISICYNHYRTIWFNTFKSAGIPHFALEGVQVRYESPVVPVNRESRSELRTFGEASGIRTADLIGKGKKRSHKSKRDASAEDSLLAMSRFISRAKAT